MVNPGLYAENNLNGAVNILNAMAKTGVKVLVFSSSAAVYGMPEYLPVDEKHPLNPISFYGFTKQETERLMVWYDRLKGIRYTALRYFNAAGYDASGAVKGPPGNRHGPCGAAVWSLPLHAALPCGGGRRRSKLADARASGG